MNRDYPYPFSPRTLDINGNRLSYLDEGEGDAVLLLHGNPTWSFYYRNLTLSFKDRFRMIVPDHMGCGLSDKPQSYPYRLEDHISNIERLSDHLGLKKLSLVMHDWGGAIGMGFAARHPEKIKSFVVMNTAAFRSSRIPLRIGICRTPCLGPLLVRGFNAFSRGAVFMAVSRKMTPETVRGYLAPYDSWRNRIAVLRFIEDIPLSERDSSWKTLLEVEAGLTKFKDTPVLILWGGKDFCFTRYFYERWKEFFPKAETRYFPEAGHYLLEDAFEEIAPLVDEFLTTSVPPA
ncbi:MAG: alpha/beta fold hydrolase [Desulfobulbaceae bacterium]|nr:alpha/beta fold hydrolase [Desulfobulbaceae bacterium]